MADAPPILIAGAGIAGLTLGLALARLGLGSRILERRPVLSEAGAGIQIGPNGMKVLRRLGVDKLLEPTAGKPNAIVVADGASGRRLASLPLGAEIERRHGAPYWVAHRADLQAALVEAVRAAPSIQLETGFEVAGLDLQNDGVVVRSASGTRATGAMLIGADGVWSRTRAKLFPDVALSYFGKMAMRTVIPLADATARFREPVTGVWLSADAHVVHYPVRGHREIAVVAIVDEAGNDEGWGREIEGRAVLERLARFAPELTGFLGKDRDWRVWSLANPPSLPAWSRERICLIGDAAHPVLPFLAQGGVMAMEDAETLAALIARHVDSPARAFARFEALRRRRMEKMIGAAKRNGRIYHLSGLQALARDTFLRVMPGSMVMSQYDWLYGWDGDGV